jgi:hypothetical protein
VLSDELTIVELKSKISSEIMRNLEGRPCHLTNPLSLQSIFPLTKGGFPQLRLRGLRARNLNVESEVREKCVWVALDY